MSELKDAHKIRRNIRDAFSAAATCMKSLFGSDDLIVSHRYYRHDRYGVRYKSYTVAGVTEFQLVARKVTDNKYKLFTENLQITNSSYVREKVTPVRRELSGTYSLPQVFARMQKLETDTEKEHNLTDKQPRTACYFKKHKHFMQNNF